MVVLTGHAGNQNLLKLLKLTLHYQILVDLEFSLILKTDGAVIVAHHAALLSDQSLPQAAWVVYLRGACHCDCLSVCTE